MNTKVIKETVVIYKATWELCRQQLTAATGHLQARRQHLSSFSFIEAMPNFHRKHHATAFVALQYSLRDAGHNVLAIQIIPRKMPSPSSPSRCRPRLKLHSS